MTTTTNLPYRLARLDTPAMYRMQKAEIIELGEEVHAAYGRPIASRPTLARMSKDELVNHVWEKTILPAKAYLAAAAKAAADDHARLVAADRADANKERVLRLLETAARKTEDQYRNELEALATKACDPNVSIAWFIREYGRETMRRDCRLREAVELRQTIEHLRGDDGGKSLMYEEVLKELADYSDRKIDHALVTSSSQSTCPVTNVHYDVAREAEAWAGKWTRNLSRYADKALDKSLSLLAAGKTTDEVEFELAVHFGCCDRVS